MSFELARLKHIEDELRALARDQLGKAADELIDSKRATFRRAVYESRKRVKKIRAAAVLLERAGAGVPRKDRKRLKRVARSLSGIRDSAATVETFDRLRRRYPKQLPEHTYAVLRRALVRARDRQESAARTSGAAADAAARLKRARASAKRWQAAAIATGDFVEAAADQYRRCRKAMRAARETRRSAAVHRWRKELKTLWYFLRLVKPVAIGVAPVVARMRRLETDLGDDHNLVVLAATLRGCPDLRSMGGDVRHVGMLAARMRDSLRRRAFALGQRLLSKKPKAFARWLRAASKRERRHPTAA